MNAKANTPIPLRVTGLCSSGKITYSTYAYAMSWIARINAEAATDKPLTAAYQCQACDGWHATSQDQALYAARRKKR